MIVNGSYIEESYSFNTKEACQAFCRVHDTFIPTITGNVAVPKYGSFCIGTSNLTDSINGNSFNVLCLSDQLKEAVYGCRLSYKNIIVSSLLGSITGTKYKMGNAASISHPVIFTYGIGALAPFLTLWLLLCMLPPAFMHGVLPLYNTMTLFACLYVVVELVIPWINSYSVDPVEEPWLIPKWLDENGIEL